jgi:hypothetical protein
MTVSNDLMTKITIAAVRAMWDSRREKSFYERMNWLDGMDSEYFQILCRLFSTYGKGEETIKMFAKRIAGL